MTLILGVKCESAVIMAADGAVTETTDVGEPQSRQAIEKLEILDKKMIFGMSGDLGMAQRLAYQFGELAKTGAHRKQTPIEAATFVRETVERVVTPDLRAATAAAQAMQNSGIRELARFSVLVCFESAGDVRLWEIPTSLIPWEVGAKLPTTAIGSGAAIARPFLAFLRRVLWPPSGLPSQSDGELAAFWTLRHAIATNPGGIAPPMQLLVAQLDKKAKTLRIDVRTEPEMAELERLVVEAEDTLRKYFKLPPPPQTPPEPPPAG